MCTQLKRTSQLLRCWPLISSVRLLWWSVANQMQVNPSKTEVLWCASGRRQHQIPTSPVRISSTYVLPVSSVRDLGVYIDSDVSLRTHVTATVRSCFAALHQIRRVRRCFPADTNPCFDCQQGWLLLFCAGRCLQSSTGQAAVHPQCCRPTRVLSQALRTRHHASPRPSLVPGPGTD